MTEENMKAVPEVDAGLEALAEQAETLSGEIKARRQNTAAEMKKLGEQIDASVGRANNTLAELSEIDKKAGEAIDELILRNAAEIEKNAQNN